MNKRKEILIAALKDADADVRKAAAEALERLEARERLDALAKKIEAGQMLERVKVIYPPSDLRGPRVAAILSAALKDPSEDVRAAAARALGTMADATVLQALVESLKDASPIVVRAGVEAISNFRDPGLLGPPVRALKHQDSGVVERALEAVSRFGDKRAEEALVYFASKGNAKMKGIALRGLGIMDA